MKFKGYITGTKSLLVNSICATGLKLRSKSLGTIVFRRLSPYCLLLIIYCQLTSAQLFPVQANPQLIPPYSVKLSDYATTTSEKLILNLLLTDVNEADLQVLLRFSIDGDRVDIRSTDFIQGAATISLTGGVPLRLSNLDLRPYFNLQNLEGITPQQYNTPLPDGLYQFCFEVFDQVTRQALSQKTCVPAYLVLNDPPFLNLPQRGELVMASNPQNIIFQWTPRHLNATGVQYEFELRELWDTKIDPQAAFLASPNLYSTTTFATTLLYGPGETVLLDGKNYGWRVRAIVSDGISETSIFKNDGYSEIFHFTHTGQCDAPKFVLAKSEGTTKEEISWQLDPKHIQYQIQFRKKASSSGEGTTGSRGIWFEQETTDNTKTLHFLEPATTYEFRVGGQCTEAIAGKNPSYSYSQINTFTTPGREEASNYNCGIAPEIVITNQKQIEQIMVNDVFTAGDFPVTIQEVYGNNGNFSGWGYITVPYLADTQLRVVFDNIRINTDKQLIAGVVETAYDPDFATGDGNEGVDDIADELELINDIIEAIEGLIDDIVDSIKDGNNADALVELWQDLLDDPDSGLTDEQREALEELVKPENRDAIKEAIKATRQAIESGAADEVIEEQLKESLKSNLVPDSNTGGDNTVDPSDLLAKIITALSNSGDIGAIKCKKCEENIEPLDGSYVITISGQNYACIVAKLLSNGIEFISGNNIPESASSSIAPYYNLISDEITGEDDVLYMFNQQGELTDCDIIYPLPETFCTNPVPSSDIEIHLTEEIEQCVDTVLNEIQQKLLALNQSFRSNQKVQFVRNGNIYRLNSNNEIEVVENALTDSQIENGEWTDDGIDQIFRVYENENGVLQFAAVGIRGNLSIFDGKTADLQSLSQNMKDKGNVFLESFNVVNISDTPQQKGATLDSDDFADGEQVNIDESANFFKIISEAGGKMGTLLKTGEIEESTYLSTTKTTEIIHAPPIVTGSTEAATRAVTDITGVVVLVYDLGTDAEARRQTWQGLKKVKDKVVENPSALFPLLTDILVEEATGNTPEDWAEISNEGTDSGRKGHLTTKGAVRTTVTIFASGKLLLKLPDMAAELSLKLLRSKLFKQMDDLGWDEALKDAFKADFDDAVNIDFKELFEQADEVRQVELLKSWESVRDAIPNQSGTTQFALDPNTVNKVADYLSANNVAKLEAIGGVDELKSFITKHSDVPCSTCNGGGLPVFGTRTMDEMIENFVEIGHIFKDHPNLWQKLKIGTESANAAMREGTQHTLKVFKDNPSKYAPDNIADLDMKFESVLDDICENCRFDVKFTNAVDGVNPKFAEFKSYNSNTWTNIKNSSKFIRQFKRYLQDVTDLNDLQYIVNTSKAPLDEIKTAFKEMMASKKDEIFEVIWINENLRKSLFGNAQKADALLDFGDMINVVDEDLFKFIKVE